MKFKVDYPIAKHTWFQVGGNAESFAKPNSVAELQEILRLTEHSIFILGAGSNVLIRDGGIQGLTLKLGRDFTKIVVNDNFVTAGASVLDKTLALTVATHGLSGIEFMSGIPGSVGGAVKMNAGCYGKETAEYFENARFMQRNGKIITLEAKDINFSYRHSNLDSELILLDATFKLQRSAINICQQEIQRIQEQREVSQPTKGRTGGSTFKNPKDLSAWQLIDQAGCRGLSIGDAQISHKHCNFLLNLGNASSLELETLAQTVREKVLATSGVELEWEIIRIGDF